MKAGAAWAEDHSARFHSSLQTRRRVRAAAPQPASYTQTCFIGVLGAEPRPTDKLRHGGARRAMNR